MGDMAAGTVPFLDRRMLCLGPFLPLDSVSMTRAANRDKRGLQKAALSGCVGIVAAQTSLLAHHRPVHLVLAQYLIHCIVMASTAQLVTGFLCRKGGLGSRIIMALVAHPVCDRSVNIIIENSSPVGTMGVVA